MARLFPSTIKLAVAFALLFALSLFAESQTNAGEQGLTVLAQAQQMKQAPS